MSGFRPRSVPLAAAILLAASGCSSNASKTTGSGPAASSPPTTSSSPAAPSSSSVASGPQITISNFAFSPVNLTVHPGQKVTVVNHDSTAHTLTSTGGTVFDTGTINPGQTGTFTAPATAGTYAYFCTFHQFMHGTLTVS